MPGNRGRQGSGHGGERGAESVTGVGEELSAVGRDGLVQDLVVPGEVALHRRPVPLPPAGAAFDVGEQEGEGAARGRVGDSLLRAQGSGASAGFRTGVELEALSQDLAFEGLDGRAGFQTQLVGQDPAETLVGGEGVGLTSQSVQGQHLQADQALPEEVFADQPLDRGQGDRRTVGGQLGVGELLGHVQAGAVQADGGDTGKVPVGEIGQGRATPERQGGGEALGHLHR